MVLTSYRVSNERQERSVNLPLLKVCYPCRSRILIATHREVPYFACQSDGELGKSVLAPQVQRSASSLHPRPALIETGLVWVWGVSLAKE